MRITLRGAAGEVTGSAYLIETAHARVLVDLGLFQGHDATDERNMDLGPIPPRKLDAVVLSHAHLDHSGRLPLLIRGGYRGRIHATPATIDFADLLLADSAHLQQVEAERRSRRLMRQGKPPVKPLYSQVDLAALQPAFSPLPYGARKEIAEGITARLLDAGHIPGSSTVELTVREEGRERIVVFSGDLGPRNAPLLRDPDPPTRADLVVLESTYGDRNHRSFEETLDEFRNILRDAYRGREKVLIPAFAVGREQEVLYLMAQFFREGSVPKMPIYLDSPLGIEATLLYRKHSDLLDAETTALLRSHQLERDLSELHFVRTAEESKTLNNLRDAVVILAGSGMCQGGRIVHHLKHNLWRRYVHVVFVGYQAEGTLGARLVHGAKQVQIEGEPIAVAAEVHTLGGFSAHAGQDELLDWFGALAPSRPRLLLTHGEDRSRAALRERIRERFAVDAECPEFGATIELL